MDRVINDIHLTNIGDALRETLGEDTRFPPEDMSEALKFSNEQAFNNGYEEGEEFGYQTGFIDGDEQGYQAGLEQGYNSGKTDGIEEGKKTQYDEFWDSFQSNGTRTDYTRTFCSTTWNNTTFYPKHQIKPKLAQQMFYRNAALTGEIEAITNIDWSNCTNFNQACQDLQGVTRLGVLDLRKATDITNAFIYMTELTTIDKIIFGDNTPNITFTQDSSLENIKTEGVISNDIAFKNSPLSAESLKSVISCLKDYTGTTSEYTKKVTFLTSAFDVLEAEGDTSPNGNSWAEYIDDLKWNLVKG